MHCILKMLINPALNIHIVFQTFNHFLVKWYLWVQTITQQLGFNQVCGSFELYRLWRFRDNKSWLDGLMDTWTKKNRCHFYFKYQDKPVQMTSAAFCGWGLPLDFFEAVGLRKCDTEWYVGWSKRWVDWFGRTNMEKWGVHVHLCSQIIRPQWLVLLQEVSHRSKWSESWDDYYFYFPNIYLKEAQCDEGHCVKTFVSDNQVSTINAVHFCTPVLAFFTSHHYHSELSQPPQTTSLWKYDVLVLSHLADVTSLTATTRQLNELISM